MISKQTPAEMIAQYHARGGSKSPLIPTLDTDVAMARVEFIEEECRELRTGVEASNIVAVADALGDLVYTVYGLADKMGIDLDAVVAEIHRSNLTKTHTPGEGKSIKGSSYSPPDLTQILFGSEAAFPAQLG